MTVNPLTSSMTRAAFHHSKIMMMMMTKKRKRRALPTISTDAAPIGLVYCKRKGSWNKLICLICGGWSQIRNRRPIARFHLQWKSSRLPIENLRLPIWRRLSIAVALFIKRFQVSFHYYTLRICSQTFYVFIHWIVHFIIHYIISKMTLIAIALLSVEFFKCSSWIDMNWCFIYVWVCLGARKVVLASLR